MSLLFYYIAIISMFTGATYITVVQDVSLFKVIFGFAFLVGLLLVRSPVSKLPSLQFMAPFWIFLLTLVVSVTRSAYLPVALTDFSSFIAGMVAAWSAFLFIQNRKHFATVAHLFVWLGMLGAVLGIAQVFLGPQFYVFLGKLEPGELPRYGRAMGLQGNPNGLASLLILAFFFALGLSAEMTGRLRFVYRWVLAPILLFGLVLTFSRSGLLALVLGLAGFALRAKSVRTAVATAVFLGLAGGIIYWVLSSGLGGTSRWTMEKFQTNVRWQMFSQALGYIAENPVFGLGAQGYAIREGRTLHVSLLAPLVEQGLIGGAAFLYLVVRPFFGLVGVVRRMSTSKTAWLFWALAWGYAALLFHGNLHGGWQNDPILWLMMGIGFRIRQIHRIVPEALTGETQSSAVAPRLGMAGFGLPNEGVL